MLRSNRAVTFQREAVSDFPLRHAPTRTLGPHKGDRRAICRSGPANSLLDAKSSDVFRLDSHSTAHPPPQRRPDGRPSHVRAQTCTGRRQEAGTTAGVIIYKEAMFEKILEAHPTSPPPPSTHPPPPGHGNARNQQSDQLEQEGSACTKEGSAELGD